MGVYEMSTTTISITPETKARLEALGKKNETYEDIIIRLIEEPEFRQKAEKVLETLKECEEIINNPQRSIGKYEIVKLSQSYEELTRLIKEFTNELKSR